MVTTYLLHRLLDDFPWGLLIVSFFHVPVTFLLWVLGKLDRIFSCFLVNLFITLSTSSPNFAIPCAAMALEAGSPAITFTPQVVLCFKPLFNLYVVNNHRVGLKLMMFLFTDC